MTWQPLCDLDALAVGTPRGVRIDRVGICLVRTAEGIFAVHDERTHGCVPLSDRDV